MVNWKIVNELALVFGVVFAVFTVIVGIVTYQIDKLAYTAEAPTSFIDYSVIAATLPYLLAAVISFAVVVLSYRVTKSTETQETETQEEVTQETETQPREEDTFEETPT
jgi:TRAP-type C4-dicarboxylate transport system permease small subunit